MSHIQTKKPVAGIWILYGSVSLLALVIAATPLPAQVAASISGTVVDTSSAAIPGAKVTATSLETGSLRTAETDAAGNYRLLSLPVGQYELQAEKTGFKTVVRTGINLAVGQEAAVNFSLEVGEVRQTVNVSAEAPLVTTTTASTAGLVNEQQVKDLPLNGRSFDNLLTLNPGIVNYTSQKVGGVGATNTGVGNYFAVSGRRPQENLFLLNGVEYTGSSQVTTTPGGTSGQLLGVDAIREFNVVTDTYGAEYGKRPGAQVTMVTASGTNQLHGSLFEFLRNSLLDARNFFDQADVAALKRNQFGASLGGPIRKDKTFLFGNYEGFRGRFGISDVTIVPDLAARQGLLINPATGRPVGLAPGVAPLLALWPLPNGPELLNTDGSLSGAAKSFSQPVQIIREDFGTTRLDRSFSSRDSFSASYTIDDGSDKTPAANPLSVIFEDLRAQVLSLQETHVFSANTVNTLRAGFSRAAFFFLQVPTVDAPSFVAGKPPGVVVIGGGAGGNAASAITPAGANAATGVPAVRNLFTYTDEVQFNRGRHQINVGAWFERLQANDRLGSFQFGQASFTSLITFLQGTVNVFQATVNPTAEGWRSLEGAWYVQDSIRLKPHLTVALGFRDEFTTGYNEHTGRASNFVFGPGGVLLTQPMVGHRTFTENNARFLPAPRVALAWDPFGRGKTSIHAGFGISYWLQDNLSFRMDSNAPFNTLYSLRGVPLSSILPFSPPATAGTIAPAGVQPDLKTPTVEAWSFKIEQELTPNTRLSLGYVGSHGYHEIISLDANTVFPVICPAAPCPANLAAGTKFFPAGAAKRNPNLANTFTWFSWGDSSYHALQIDVTHRLSHGLQLRGNYTFAKSLDDGSSLTASVSANTPQTGLDPGNLRLDRGLSPFDVRNRFGLNGIYELPIGRTKPFLAGVSGLTDKLVSGWALDAIFSTQDGFPFTPQLGFNQSRTGDTRAPDRPSRNPSFNGRVILGGPDQYYDPLAFVLPQAGTFGNVARDALIGPGLTALDIGLTKKTSLSDRLSLQFRAEFFNLLNRANFNIPNPIVFNSNGTPSPSAGVITSTTTTSRQIQLSLKLVW